MLQTNLSTRPFYNIRAVRLTLVVIAALLTALSILSINRAIALRSSEDQLSARATEAVAEAARLRNDATRIRSKVNQTEQAQLAADAAEANAVIEQRAFSWIGLLNRIESALPDDVRVTRVEPRVDRQSTIVVAISAEAKDAEAYADFMDALERTGRFHEVLPRSETHDEEGLNVMIEGRYTPETTAVEPARVAATPGGARR